MKVPDGELSIARRRGLPTAATLRMSMLLGAFFILLGGCTAVNQPGELCVSSSIEVRPTSSPPGGTVVVTGQNFFRGCNDLGGSPAAEEMVPERGIGIEFHQGSHSWPLGRVDATSDFSFEAVMQIPTAAAAGPATFLVSSDSGTVEAQFDVL